MENINVFISYSNHDLDLLVDSRGKETLFLRYLKRIENHCCTLLWDRVFISGGDEITEEVKKAVKESDIFVAILSDDFIHSHWCQEKEIGEVLKDKMARRNKKIIPFYKSYCKWERIPWLLEKKLLALPSFETPYDAMDKNNQLIATLQLRDCITDNAKFLIDG